MRRKVVICEKAGAFGVIALTQIDVGTVVTNFDGRNGSRFSQIHPTLDSAQAHFDDSVAVTRERGWAILWSGEPQWG
jgi:hypothetical protein